MESDIDHSVGATVERMERRREALMAILPQDLQQREDDLPGRVRTDNASAQSKIGKVFALVDEISAYRAPYVACAEGCASCCKMNVQITSVEAARITAGTGRKARPLQRSVRHPDGRFAGQACPFLKDEACSIYEHRPFVCRHHAHFDVDSYWCDPIRMQEQPLPLLELTGAKQAMTDVLMQARQPVLADIRDFFGER